MVNQVKLQTSKYTICHILCFEKDRRPVALPDKDAVPGKQKRHAGAIHPDGLLSTYTPEEDAVASGASTTGWVWQKLTPAELADALGMPSNITLSSNIMENKKTLCLIGRMVPSKVIVAVLGVFSAAELKSTTLVHKEGSLTIFQKL
eukprot:10808851-Ditylum_brightwellii.AAC.1